MSSLPLPRMLDRKPSRRKIRSNTVASVGPAVRRRNSRPAARAAAFILAALCALAGAVASAKQKPPLQYQIPTPAQPDFSALEWLQGQWTGKTLPNSPAGELKLSVNYDLERHLIVFHGEVSLAATPTVPATQESWLGILCASPERNDLILQIFTSRGFITRYRVILNGAELLLNPEGGEAPPPGWLFRRVWARTAPDEFSETVQAAPPGKGFFDYYSAKFTRVPPPAKPTPETPKPAPEPPKNSSNP